MWGVGRFVVRQREERDLDSSQGDRATMQSLAGIEVLEFGFDLPGIRRRRTPLNLGEWDRGWNTIIRLR